MFHAQWDILLDEEFMEAYVHGIVVLCCDGVTRRFYPRIFIYSADYPEKYVPPCYVRPSPLTPWPRVLIASIRDKGQCPCPRCTASLSDVEQLGTVQDMERRTQLARVDDDAYRQTIKAARNLILKHHHAIDSKEVEELLKAHSTTPTDVSAASA